MSGRFIGNFVQTFQSGKTLFTTSKGLKKGLLSCCGSNYKAVPKSHHGHGSSLLSVNCSANGIKTHLFQQTRISDFSIRQYSSKIQSTPTPKTLLSNLCETELNDFKTLIPEQDDIQSFLEESGFTLRTEKDGMSDVVFLTKTFADGTEITVKFDSLENQDQLPEDFEDYNQENQDQENQDQDQDQDQEEEREEEEQEEQQEGQEGQENQEHQHPHEHPFEIQIKSTKGNESKLTFGGFASQDGNYTISGFYKGGFSDTINPVDIAGTSSDFQDNILLLLQQYGINEKLSFFVHDYVHNKKLQDYIQSFEALKDFVSRK